MECSFPTFLLLRPPTDSNAGDTDLIPLAPPVKVTFLIDWHNKI